MFFSLTQIQKRLTLEEMDLVFGSSGIAQADQERMRQINIEIGLARAMGYEQDNSSDEKVAGAASKESAAEESEKISA